MKLVINKCYGGFGLSANAIKRIAELGSTALEITDVKEYFGGNHEKWADTWGKRYQEELAQSVDIGDGFMADKHGSTLYKDGKAYSFPRDDKSRTDPILVQVVEEMGDVANGGFARLKVVEIPDGTQWELSEYDGIERVHEVHNSWG